ncbi:MAG: hypothetical protein ACOYYJ_10985 [Chloroflexota bacterium]
MATLNFENENRSLDDWYKLINSIYLEANFYRDSDSILIHLYEILGGVATLTMGKKKLRVSIDIFLAKAIGWWLSLCGKVGVRSVEEMIWAKYPYLCPYCQSSEHIPAQCKGSGRKNDIDWKALRDRADRNRPQKPRTISEWQRMFHKIYGSDEIDRRMDIQAHIMEEMGELAEAVRFLPVNHLHFMNEAIDVFAWIMRYANEIETAPTQDERHLQHMAMLERAMMEEYPGHCKYCGQLPCKCPPVPEEALIRISKALPEEAFPDVRLSKLLSFQEAVQLFRTSSTYFRFAGSSLVEKEIREMANYLIGLISRIESQDTQISHLILSIQDISNKQSITQASVDNLVEDLQNASPEFRNILINFLEGINAGIWTEVLIRLLSVPR